MPRPEPLNGLGGIAVADAPLETAVEDEFHAPVHVRAFSEAIRQPFIEMASATEPGQVFTIIEVLSPANKRLGPGAEDYRRVQEQILRNETHLLEIDPLREGTHTVAAPLSSRTATGAGWDYLVCLHRARWGAAFHTRPIRLRERLPRVSVPLTAGQRDIRLDLQTALERAWEAGG
jgi:hypothetical protein